MGKQNIRYPDPAYYIITVSGKLSEGVLENLANYFAKDFPCKYGNQVSRIEGLVKDQIALLSLLIYLCDLHYILLSVKMKNELNSTRQKNNKVSSRS